MIAVIAAAVLQASAQQPDPEVLYQQALGCAASASLAMEEASGEQASELMAEALAWGMILSDVGPRAGRTAEQVDTTDGEAAIGFFQEMRRARPGAFAAHRMYCRLLSRREV